MVVNARISRIYFAVLCLSVLFFTVCHVRSEELFPPSHSQVLLSAAKKAMENAHENSGKFAKLRNLIKSHNGTDYVYFLLEGPEWLKSIIENVFVEQLLANKLLLKKNGNIPGNAICIVVRIDSAGIVLKGTESLFRAKNKSITRSAFVDIRLRLTKGDMDLWHSSGQGLIDDKFPMKYLKMLNANKQVPVENHIEKSLGAALIQPIIYIATTTVILYYYFISREL